MAHVAPFEASSRPQLPMPSPAKKVPSTTIVRLGTTITTEGVDGRPDVVVKRSHGAVRAELF
eukprot:SAG31_NODE_4496_length_3186_cov_4.245222_4_plen_61_part_01